MKKKDTFASAAVGCFVPMMRQFHMVGDKNRLFHYRRFLNGLTRCSGSMNPETDGRGDNIF